VRQITDNKWVGWVVATITFMSFTYSEFQTKYEASLKDKTIQVQLDAIKISLDRIHSKLK